MPYDIDMQYLFEIPQNDCKTPGENEFIEPGELQETTSIDSI